MVGWLRQTRDSHPDRSNESATPNVKYPDALLLIDGPRTIKWKFTDHLAFDLMVTNGQSRRECAVILKLS